MASKHCLPRRGKLGADMKSPSQVALVALLPGERKRQREKRYCEAGRERARAYRAESVRLGIQKRQRGYWAAATASAILFQLAFATSENAQKMENYARCCKVASRAGCNLALVRSGFDVFSLPKPKTGENCQTKKYCGYSLSFSLSLSNLISSLSLQLQQAQTEYQITNKCICSYSYDSVYSADCIYSCCLGCGKYLQLWLWLYLQLLK